MMFAKLAFRNIKGKIRDYLIYVLTLTVLAAMMLSAFMLVVFPAFTGNEGVTLMAANSLPLFIALTLLFLMIYMNQFMLKRRNQEFAIYMLSGIQKNEIGTVYFVEHILLGLVSIIIGLLLGLLIFWGILTAFTATWSFLNILSAVIKAVVYFSMAHILSLVFTVFYIRKLNIKKLLYHSSHNEQMKTTTIRLISLSLATIMAYLIYFYQINHFSHYTGSTLAFTIGFILYGSYAVILGWLKWYRERHGGFLYHNRRIFIAGQIVARIKTQIRMSAVISGCLLIAICSTVYGLMSVTNAGQILGEQLDTVMGFVQFYISVLFTVIVFSIIALQQIVDAREHKQKCIVLKRLGTDNDNANRILFQQVLLNFTIPIIFAIVLMLCSINALEQNLQIVLHKEHLITNGFLIYMSIFAILYVCYIAAVYTSLKNVKYV